jgi:hypothetical protein
MGMAMMNSIEALSLFKALDVKKIQPFRYDLGIEVVAHKKSNAGVTICCHGYGGSSHTAEIIDSFKVIPDHIVSFNFPDYDLTNRPYNPLKSSFGSINELLPFLYIIKRCVCDAGLSAINLYGFSAGGAAVVNTLVVLNESAYDEQLASIGITLDDKKRIIAAVQRGIVVLDCPLKSFDEVMQLRGRAPELVILSERYLANHMQPLESVQRIKGLKCHILLHFQQPDEVIGNRDDQFFIDRLRTANEGGVTEVVIGHDGGHNTYHASLWRAYTKFRNKHG